MSNRLYPLRFLFANFSSWEKPEVPFLVNTVNTLNTVNTVNLHLLLLPYLGLLWNSREAKEHHSSGTTPLM